MEECIGAIYFEPEIGDIATFSWSVHSRVRIIHALNDLVRLAGLNCQVIPFEGRIYSAKDTRLRTDIMAISDAEDIDMEEFDEEGNPVIEMTGRYMFAISQISEGLIERTGLLEAIVRLRDSIGPVKAAIEKQVNMADSFAAHFGEALLPPDQR